MADEKPIITAGENGEWKIDAETFDPKPAGHIKIKGVEYPIYSFLDVPVDLSVRVVNLNEDIKDGTFDDRWKRAIDQILILNRGPLDADEKPKHARLLTEPQLRALPLQILVSLSAMATSVAVPLKDDGAASASQSADSTPAALAPSGGPTGT